MTPRPRRIVEGTAVPLLRDDVDTDQIVPKQFLKRITREGYGDVLFHDWRFRPSGEPEPTFVLNRPEFSGSRILISGRNFGCGSSREHAVWALLDWGIQAVLAVSFADIFRTNCIQAGLVPVALAEEVIRDLATRAASGGCRVRVDLERGEVTAGRTVVPFSLDEHARWRLMAGLDAVDWTLRFEEEIAAYERERMDVE